MLTRRLLSTTLTKACARPSVRVQIRSNTGVTVKDYFNPYFPPNGKLEELPDQTPHDFTKRPKRINTRLGTRLDRILRFTDYHSLKKQPEAKRVRPKPPPREVPEARNGMTYEKFMNTIGRGCEEHMDKIGSWEALFTMKGEDMKAKEVPVRQRRWILRWVELYRQGIDPWFIPLKSKTKKNLKLEWRMQRITQKDKRRELGLE